MVRCFVETINAGGVPCIESAAKIMSDTENTKAVKLAKEAYTWKMQKVLNLPVSDRRKMAEAHQSSFLYAREVFINNSFNDDKKVYYDRACVSMYSR